MGRVDHLVRDLLEIAILVAVIGMLVSAVRRLRRGQIDVVRCQECGRPTSRAYPTASTAARFASSPDGMSIPSRHARLPEGEEKARAVRAMFDAIAPR